MCQWIGSRENLPKKIHDLHGTIRWVSVFFLMFPPIHWIWIRSGGSRLFTAPWFHSYFHISRLFFLCLNMAWWSELTTMLFRNHRPDFVQNPKSILGWAYLADDHSEEVPIPSHYPAHGSWPHVQAASSPSSQPVNHPFFCLVQIAFYRTLVDLKKTWCVNSELFLVNSILLGCSHRSKSSGVTWGWQRHEIGVLLGVCVLVFQAQMRIGSFFWKPMGPQNLQPLVVFLSSIWTI